MKILHAADLHLDSPLRGLPDVRSSTGASEETLASVARGATRRAFENLIQLAMDDQVALLLIAGDIFDGPWEDHHTGVFFAQQLRRYTEQGGQVCLVRGNHDAACKMAHHIALPAGVHRFGTGAPESKDYPDLGVTVHGWSFPTEAVTDDPTPRFPHPRPARFNVGLLHTNLGGRRGHGNYAPTTLSGLEARGYDYWALGHVHQRQVIQSGNTTVVYPGNLQGRHARETVGEDEGKGATMLTVEGGRLVSIEHHPLDVLRWHHITADLTDCDTVDACVTAVSGQLPAALTRATVPVAVRIELTGRTAAHGALLANPADLRASIEAVLPTHTAVYLERVKVRTRLPAVSGTDPLADHLQRAVEEASTGNRLALRNALLAELAPLLDRAPGGSLMEQVEAQLTDDQLEALLERAAATILHRLRG